MSHYNERLKRLRNEIEQESLPEILALQEAARWGNQSIYDPLVQWSDSKGFYQVTNHFGFMTEGLALVGRLPGSQFESLALPGTSLFSNQYIIAGVFETEIGPVGVVSCHFSPMGRNRSQRLQAQFVIGYIKARWTSIPVLVMGDLNQEPDSEALSDFVKEGFVDALGWDTKTFVPNENIYNHSKYGPERLDYILYRPTQLRLIKSSLMFHKNMISDHYGVKAEFVR